MRSVEGQAKLDVKQIKRHEDCFKKRLFGASGC